VLKSLSKENSDDITYNVVALSYRGYWKSKGRPSQAGIELDAHAALRWAHDRYSRSMIVIWGQSIGAGVASVALSQLDAVHRAERIAGLILETPFVDLKTMLVALYPQKFLPYRYLIPFLWSTWNSKSALERLGSAQLNLKVLILEAGKDEIVPSGQAEILENTCHGSGLQVERKTISGALHMDLMTKAQGRSHIVSFIRGF
jgi:uncharacterized protein